MMVELEVLKDKEVWDELLTLSSHATIFHEWEWLKIAEKHSKWAFYPLVCFKGMEPVFVLPTFYKKLKTLNLIFSPPPGLAIPYLGPLIPNDASLKRSIVEHNYRSSLKAISEFLDSFNADYTRIFTPPNFSDVRPFKWNGFTAEPFYSYAIDLGRSREELWMSIEKKLRQNVKKAKRQNFEIYEGGVRELKEVVKLVNKRYDEQNRKADVNLEYLEDIYRAFRENVRVVVVEKDGEIITGIIDLVYRDCVSSWIGNPKVSVAGTYPNDLLNWHVIEKAHEEGFRRYEIIGANTERLTEFKVRYNPDTMLYFLLSKKNLKATLANGIYSFLGGYLK